MLYYNSYTSIFLHANGHYTDEKHLVLMETSRKRKTFFITGFFNTFD